MPPETLATPLGAWELPDELKLLRQTVADFMEREVRPAEHGEDPDAYKLPAEKLEPLQAKAKAAGVWGLATPEAFGGGGVGGVGQARGAGRGGEGRRGGHGPPRG